MQGGHERLHGTDDQRLLPISACPVKDFGAAHDETKVLGIVGGCVVRKELVAVLVVQ